MLLTIGIVLAFCLASGFPHEPAMVLWKRYRSKSRIGDCTDEMFEAMREVDAITPAVEPFLASRRKPREPSSLSGVLRVAASPNKVERFISIHGGRFNPITLQIELPDGSRVDALAVHFGERV